MSAVDAPRVAVVEPVGRGGMIHYAYQLCRGLTAEGFDVELITDRHYELRELDPEFRVTRLFRLWDPKPATPLRRSRIRRAFRALRHYREWGRLVGYLRRRRPDVIQLGDLRFPLDVLPVRALRGATTVLADVCHNVEPFRGGRAGGGGFGTGRLGRAAYRLAYSSCDRIFVHYGANRARFLARYGMPSDRVRAIVHGNQELLAELDRGGSAAELRSSLGIAPGPVVLLLGALTGYKGVDLLLEAAPAVVEEVPGVRFVVVGHPLPDFDLSAHRSLAVRLGVAGRVHFHPHFVATPDIGAWLRMADVVVLPYRAVYQSGVLQLAQTFGVPVVASHVGAFPEAVVDGEDGLLHEPEDSGSLASSLARVLSDPMLRGRLAAGAAAASSGRHHWSGVAATIADEYRSVLAGKVAASDRTGRRREETP